MSRFCTSYLDSYTEAPLSAGRDFAFTHPILDSPFFTKYILLIIKRISNFALKFLRIIPGNCGSFLGNCGSFLGNCGYFLGNCGSFLGNCGSFLGNCDSFLGNCDSFLGKCGSFLGNCDINLGRYQSFRMKYDGIFGLNFCKPIVIERVNSLFSIIPGISINQVNIQH